MNEEIVREETVPGKHLILIHGDITSEKVDAIVNAANSYLKHGGGVAGAIVRKGGNIIQVESDKIGYLDAGKAAMTTAGDLPARFVIHAVGPRWGEGEEERKLKDAVLNSLRLAEENQLQSISLPAISSGIFGFPKDRCAEIILASVREYMRNNREGSLKRVHICLFDEPTLRIFREKF